MIITYTIMIGISLTLGGLIYYKSYGLISLKVD